MFAISCVCDHLLIIKASMSLICLFNIPGYNRLPSEKILHESLLAQETGDHLLTIVDLTGSI